MRFGWKAAILDIALLTVFYLHYLNYNGRLLPASEAIIPAQNRALRYGYGLYETMLVQDGELQLAESHWKRLFEGLEQLHLSFDKHFTQQSLEEEVFRTVRRNQLQRLCRIRLQVHAGPGGLLDREGWKPEFLIECFPLEPSVISLNENGLVLGFSQAARKHADALSHLKTCNSLPYAIAAREAVENRWNDALVLNGAEHVVESTIANLFWVMDGVIYTPPLPEGCIAGVMRSYLLEKLPLMGFEIVEQSVTPQQLLDAHEVFLTNAIRRIKWVGVLESRSYENAVTGQIALKLFGDYLI